jgi:Fe-S cluster assembly iron-binding protein IscA
MALVKLEPGAAKAIRAALSGKGVRGALRIELRSTGCCDASLGLLVDAISEGDLVQESEGITFVIAPEVFRLAGEVTIANVDEDDRQGFVIQPGRPLNEWDGIGVCKIRF